MKSLIIFAFVAVCSASALPAFEQRQVQGLGNAANEGEAPISVNEELLREPMSLPEADIEEVLLEEGEEHGTRLKRGTCDVLSFETLLGKLNHSACAIHCILKGYSGGKCDDAVCKCRRAVRPKPIV